MKRALKLLLISSVLTVLFAIPAFAQEVTDPTKVIMEETFTAGEDALAQEFHNSEVWRSNNYLKYLDGVVYNLNETARIKQEIVTNYKWLSQFNPQFAALIPQAEKDLVDAQAWVEAYKAYKIAVQNDLKIRYNF